VLNSTEDAHVEIMSTFAPMSIVRHFRKRGLQATICEKRIVQERLAHAPSRGAPMPELCENLVDGLFRIGNRLLLSPCQGFQS
jgi:hypothetical protein